MIKLTGDMSRSEPITSRDNQRLVDARKVRDGKDWRGRIFVEGTRLVDEAVRSRLEIDAIFVSESYSGSEALESLGLDTNVVADRIFPTIADAKTPQGIALLAKRPEHSLNSMRVTGLPVVVYLYEVNNPSNLGAVVRTAEAAGAAGVILSPGSADAYSPKALRSAMGSAFRLPVVEGVSLDEVTSWADESGMTLTCTEVNATVSYTGVDWTRPRIVVMGSEAHGLPDDMRTRNSETITIPMNTSVESLNLAVSTGVLLFEARRQNS